MANLWGFEEFRIEELSERCPLDDGRLRRVSLIDENDRVVSSLKICRDCNVDFTEIK